MNIAIDGYEANVPQRLGSSQVAFELIRTLERLDFENSYTIFLPNSPMFDLPTEREGFHYQILWPKKMWTKIALPLALYTAKEKYDLIFSPTHYIPQYSPTKRVVMIFDLSYLHFPQMFTKKDLWQLTIGSKFSIGHADHIITISKSTKSDLIKQYKIPSTKITVAYLGYDNKVFKQINDQTKIKEVKKKYKIFGDYIIYIGTIQPRKNLDRLIEAVARIENLKLVIVGKTKGEGRSGWMYEAILQKPKKLGIEDRVIFTGFVPNLDLPYLLSGALCYILVSLWEGFGIPVVEAMACGTPVVVSNVSSLPEVVGKSGLLVDPYSIDQIEQAIRTIISDKKLQAKKKKEVMAQAKKFLWENTSKKVLGVFEGVLKG